MALSFSAMVKADWVLLLGFRGDTLGMEETKSRIQNLFGLRE
jgi:hypothetical protein